MPARAPSQCRRLAPSATSMRYRRRSPSNRRIARTGGPTQTDNAAASALPASHAEAQMMKRALPVVLAAFTLAACAPKGTLDWSEVETVGMDGQLYAACAPPKGTLDRSEVETVRVDGRLYEVRVASTEVEGEYRLLLVRGTIVIDPDPNLESQRNWNV